MMAPAGFTAAVGFDGYLDRIVRVVSNADAGGKTFYKDIPEFSSALAKMAGKSGDLEFVTTSTRTGGCGPNFAQALAGLGVGTTLVGTMQHDIFKTLHPAITQIAFGTPGDTLAFEFDDGKIMMADITAMQASVAAVLDDAATMATILKAYAAADLCVLTNWACMAEMHPFGQAVLAEIQKKNSGAMIFLDLADFTKRSGEDIARLAELIRSLKGRKAYLGLNEKEALMLAERLSAPQENAQAATEYLSEALGCGVITHAIGHCVYAGPQGGFVVQGAVATRPKISTGAGDNFNAAWCYAVMQGQLMPEAMAFANQFTYDYVTGKL